MPTALRNNSLTVVMFALFLVFWFGQAVTGHRTFNAEQREHNEETVSFGDYLGSGHFWEATSENWESEFLQMASYVFLTIFLFQKGSSESKDPEKEAVDEDPRQKRGEPDVPWPVRAGGMALKV